MHMVATQPQVLRGRYGAPYDRVQAVVDRLLTGRVAPRVLEAGCGSLSRVQLPDDAYLIGVDITQRQLDANTMLDERILGNLETHAWPPASIDMVVCWDVIEHLSNLGAALDRLQAALKPGGAMVLAFPNPWSLKGMVTKLTPYWVHYIFYRYVIGDKRPRSQSDQFPTF